MVTRRASCGSVVALSAICLGQLAAPTAAQPTNGAVALCDDDARTRSEADFLRLQELRSAAPYAVTDEALAIAAASFIGESEACYRGLVGPSGTPIDDGGVWFTQPGVDRFVTFGTKWGANSPFAAGTNVSGPGTAGGTVTYSYMANGVDLSAEGAGLTQLTVASFPTFATCFFTEMETAFAAWSAVSNVQFVEVTDSGAPFNQAGASGDIRIGGHAFDGASGTLAHGYYPPPNGTSAAGDIHFDVAENWTCSAAGFDFGIVATHEIGHAIGLRHEATNTAVMNAFYNAAVTSPLADDVVGAASIYGPASCSFTINPTALSVAAAGVSTTVAVTAGAGCAWTAVSNDGFITVTGGAAGTGNGTVSYTVAANTTTSQRVGTITIAGETFTVTQQAAFTDDPLSVSTTPVKAVHITELRTRINALRAGCMLGAFSFTDPTLTAGTTQVKAAHLTELRTALSAAYVACAVTAPTYAATVTPGTTVIAAAHIAELRALVIALE